MTYSEIETIINKLQIDSNSLRKNYAMICGKQTLESVYSTLNKFNVEIPVIVDTRITDDNVYLIKDWELRSTIELTVRKLCGK